MTMRHGIAIVISLVATGCRGPESNLPPSGDLMKDQVRNLYSADAKVASEAAGRLFAYGEAAIPELVKLLGSKAVYVGHFQAAGSGAIIDESDPSQRCSIGIVSLYLVNAIYFKNINFASSLRLVDLADRTKYINDSWFDRTSKEVIKWEERRKLFGLDRLRGKGDAPLSTSQIRFY